MESLVGGQHWPHLRHRSHLHGIPADHHSTATCLSLVNRVLSILSLNFPLTAAVVLLQLPTHKRYFSMSLSSAISHISFVPRRIRRHHGPRLYPEQQYKPANRQSGGHLVPALLFHSVLERHLYLRDHHNRFDSVQLVSCVSLVAALGTHLQWPLQFCT